ncbi:MAG: UTP--glucose-1-phosphate uridylyltransferase [Thermoanaerobaculia bacterium]|nr:UTP--glucose-1-phosphate uridylyltransferase [Thermoanaerobaculia bacterium]
MAPLIEPEEAARELAACMRREGLAPATIEEFLGCYRRFRAGERGTLPWDELAPPRAGDLADRADLPEIGERRERELLDRLALIRLNGGLGTSMRLAGPKSLIPVRGGRSFLDLLSEQVAKLRRRTGARLPLLLMDSFATRERSLAALRGFEQPDGLPLDFLQQRFPRIDAESGGPARLSAAERRWAPPGHGDVYWALAASGLLDRLLAAGYRWAFVANIDNLAATPDAATLAHLEERRVEFAMEVTPKTRADVKGGTLVRWRGRLTLLERAQVEPAHVADFENTDKLPVFNTNTLWWDLEAVRRKLEEGLDLPLIVNAKREEGRDLVQLETAMGAAIGCFDRALGIRVSRRRFAPVKTTDDLLAVRSDAFAVDRDGALRLVEGRDLPPVVRLDRAYYRGARDLDERVPHPLGLAHCDTLTVEGDVRFGAGVEVRGEVTLSAGAGAARVPDGSRFDGGTHRLG